MELLLWVIAAGMGALLGFANPWLHFPAAALLLPVALTILGRGAAGPKSAFKHAWAAGSLASLALLYWVFWPVEHFGEVHWALAAPLPVLLAMAMACYHGLFGMAAYYSNRLSPLLSALFLGMAWVVMELCQATLLSGFSWLTLSSAFVPWQLCVQVASLVGAYGTSGLLVVIAASLVLVRQDKRCAVLALAVAVVMLGYGWLRMGSYVETTAARDVAVVQGNIDQGQKWDPQYQMATVEKYVALSGQTLAGGAKPALIVWPETSMPFYFQDDTPLRKPVLDFAREVKIPMLLGAPAYAEKPGPGSFTLYNRAFLLDVDAAAIFHWYDKEHLVPFGEYMPFGEYLPLQKLVSGVGDFAPGKNTQALRAGDLALGVLVCYEAIFADLAQDRVSQGANVLVNISNDAWFGDTSAPRQHLNLSALRAIEQGRYIVRCTNTGISAFIDPLGRIKLAGPQFVDLAAVGQVHAHSDMTVYHRAYGWLLGFTAFAAVAFAVLVFRGRREPAANRGLR